MTVLKTIKEIARAKKELNAVLREEVEILRQYNELEDERFNRNYERLSKIASLNRKELLNDALAVNGINFILGDHNNIPDKKFDSIIENYQHAANAIANPLGKDSKESEQELNTIANPLGKDLAESEESDEVS